MILIRWPRLRLELLACFKHKPSRLDEGFCLSLACTSSGEVSLTTVLIVAKVPLTLGASEEAAVLSGSADPKVRVEDPANQEAVEG